MRVARRTRGRATDAARRIAGCRMLATPLVVAAAFAYLLLFAIAEFADGRAATRVRYLAAHRL